jgi:hypothetical protein
MNTIRIMPSYAADDAVCEDAATLRSSPNVRKATGVRRWAMHASLLLVVLATRAPLIGNFEGEPDSARYVTGLHLWVSGDRGNHLVYEKGLSAGYYWLAAGLAKTLDVSVQHYSLMLNILSLCAALLMAPVLFELSRRMMGDNPAWICSLLFLVTPGIWWLGTEPHPQMLAVTLILFSLWAFLRGVVERWSLVWAGVSVIALTTALLLKTDTVLLFAAFQGLLLFLARWNRDLARALVRTGAILSIAILLFVFTRTITLGVAPSALQSETNQSLAGYLSVPSGVGIVHQAAPIVLALGPILFLFAATGAVLLWRNAGGTERGRWLVLMAMWCLPGWLFWFFVSGNNPRHVAIFDLPLLWAGVRGWYAVVGENRMAAAAALATLLNFFSIPANSNPTLLSPNVPASIHDLQLRESEIRELAGAASRRGGASCFYGTYTVPYFRLYAIQAGGPDDVSLKESPAGWSLDSSRFSVFIPATRAGAGPSMQCSPSYSVEYTPAGEYRRFFGKEIYSSPVWCQLASLR